MDFSALSILNLVFYLLVILFSLSVHESAHAWAAWKLGDPTAKMLGRVTLNPLPHIDPVGTVLVPAVMALGSMALSGHPIVFGWAKPVPVISRNFKHLRRDEALVAAAGPASNLIVAGITTAVLLISLLVLGGRGFSEQMAERYSPMNAILNIGFTNLVLAAFNLIPVPPLDGSWVFSALLPRGVAHFYERIRPFGAMILLLLMATGASTIVLTPVLFVLQYLFFVIPLSLISALLGS